MKKNLLKAALMTLTLTSGFAVTADAHERDYIAHVTNVHPVYETRLKNRFIAETQCRDIGTTGQKRINDLVVGSLIGSVIGNKISDTPGFGTLGALAGWSLTESRSYSDQDCNTVWRPQKYKTRVLSHYAISLTHLGRVVRLRSQHQYNIGDHVRLGH
jgi:uncharacterized protein YcfJ